ncbi:hypothetical protein [Flavobacterium sp.]|uniref:hypothetical protein n=1 Tax=Flavobacterium sp. TaxID=239 RepID=UPI00391917CA
MYYSAITNAAYIITALFIFLFIRTFSKVTLSQLWKLAVQKVKTTLRIKSEIEKAIARGEREFLFKNGTIRIYAKTQPMALYKFKEMQRKEKAAQLLATMKTKPKTATRILAKNNKKAS